MKEITGNIWNLDADRRVITISGEYYGDPGYEKAIMTSGIAKQARDRYPGLDEVIGCLLSLPTCGIGVFPLPFDLIMFPVKMRDKDDADLQMILVSAAELVEVTNRRNWTNVLLPRPGTGKGGLLWETVRPELAEVLDNRFTCVTYEQGTT